MPRDENLKNVKGWRLSTYTNLEHILRDFIVYINQKRNTQSGENWYFIKKQ